MTKKKPKSFFAFYIGKSVYFGSKWDTTEKKIYLGTNEKKARKKFNKLLRQLYEVEKVLEF